MRRWQKALGYVHDSADPLQHLVDGRRALAGLLAYGYHRPCSAFPDRKRSSGCPSGPEPDFPIHSGEGRTGITPDFPFTKAWRQ
ncbi:hypothetical protein SLITK23_57830 [Streptomyces lividans]|uniref:Uncharacterized protein n=2 Tax=Streptomyces TaxID=1883 RepID=A0A7U9HE64_STRLI|nr:hypothetical protein SLI_6242 [Streptomyces lividans 1326]BDD75476.1 hypothetical protein JCM4020_60960 [Streptomyces coelicolor]BDE42538.1 hypothetical protein SLITK23_57830 [Streptomyces lividans]GHA63001.1 hypothetical protein GCM10010391_55780 [Streptomyces anthocyanicus]GHC05743.1 hypothetical protein GCM10010348_29140 [Streptomyces anthocyanicus]